MTAAPFLTDLDWLITRLRREQRKPATHRPRHHRRAGRGKHTGRAR